MKAFGLDVVKKDKGYFGVRQCSQCGGLVDVHLLELTGVDRFCFLPVKIHITKRYLHCSKCDALFTLSDEQWAHYKSYLHHRLSKKTTEEILTTLNNINKVYEEQGVRIDIDDKTYHPALDDICDNLIKKYGHKENMEELISVFFISKQNNN
jgi:hypothetical protein